MLQLLSLRTETTPFGPSERPGLGLPDFQLHQLQLHSQYQRLYYHCHEQSLVPSFDSRDRHPSLRLHPHFPLLQNYRAWMIGSLYLAADQS